MMLKRPNRDKRDNKRCSVFVWISSVIKLEDHTPFRGKLPYRMTYELTPPTNMNGVLMAGLQYYKFDTSSRREVYIFCCSLEI